MLYVMGELLLPLLAIILGGAIAGWSLHCVRSRRVLNERKKVRDRLRADLLSLADTDVNGERAIVLDTEQPILQTRLDVALSRVKELEQALAQIEAAKLTTDTVETPEDPTSEAVEASDDVAALRWRIHYLEGRLTEVEAEAQAVHLAAPAPVVDDEEVQRLRARIAELEAGPVQSAPNQLEPVDGEDERLRWQTRYYAARVKYLEQMARIAAPAPAAAPSPPVDSEAENRRRWRIRYLEARLNYLASRLKDSEGARAEALAAQDGLQGRLSDMSVELDARAARMQTLEADLAHEIAESAARQAAPAPTSLAAFATPHFDLSRALAERVPELELKIDTLQAAARRSEADALRVPELEGLLARARKDTQDSERREADLEAALANLRAHAASLEAAEAERLQRAAQADVDAAGLREMLAASETDLETHRGKVQVAEEALTESQSKLAMASAEIEQQRARLAQAEERARLGDGALAARDARIGELEKRLGELEAHIETMRTEHGADLEQHAARIAEISGVADARGPEREDARRQLAALEQNLMDSRAQAGRIGLELNQSRGVIAALERQLEAARARVAELEGMSAAPRRAPAQPPASAASFAPLAPGAGEMRPQGLPAPRGGAPDDLRLIEGVAPRVESTLHSLGIYHFDQIAAWTQANVNWVERYLAFRGRIGRERWLEQAQALKHGERTQAAIEPA